MKYRLLWDTFFGSFSIIYLCWQDQIKELADDLVDDYHLPSEKLEDQMVCLYVSAKLLILDTCLTADIAID